MTESAATAGDELLNELRSSKTDLARLVEAVLRNRPPYVVVSSQAVTSWERREPQHWAKVSEWLADSNVSLVKV